MIDPAAFVSPIRLIVWVVRTKRKANSRALTSLNTRRSRRWKFNGDFQLLVLIVTSLALLPMVWWFSCELVRRGEAGYLTRSAYVAESAKIAQPVVPSVVRAEALGASLRSAVGKKYRPRRQSASSRYLPSLVMQQSSFESSRVAQEIGNELLFEVSYLEVSHRSDLYVMWECDDCRKGRLEFASKIADWFRCGVLLLAGLASVYYSFRLRARAVKNRLKLYSQLSFQRHSSKHQVFKTHSRASARMRWREWSIQSRWLS